MDNLCISSHELGINYTKLEMRGKAQCVARLAQTCLQNSKHYWTKVHQIFIKRRRLINGVNACVHVAILPSIVESQRTQ